MPDVKEMDWFLWTQLLPHTLGNLRSGKQLHSDNNNMYFFLCTEIVTAWSHIRCCLGPLSSLKMLFSHIINRPLDTKDKALSFIVWP